MLVPGKKYALIELIDKYVGIATLEGKYNDRVSGVCLSVGDDEYKHLINKRVYWQEFKAGDVIEKDNKKYCAILLEDIAVYETS